MFWRLVAERYALAGEALPTDRHIGRWPSRITGITATDHGITRTPFPDATSANRLEPCSGARALLVSRISEAARINQADMTVSK